MDTQPINELAQALEKALLEGNEEKVGDLFENALERGVSLQTLYVEVIGEAQSAIGRLWQCGAASIAQEHRATQILLDQLTRLRQSTRQRKKLGVRVVVAALQGDFHVLGARMVADLLYLDGWDVDFLGGDTPVDALVTHINEVKPRLVGISVSNDKLFPQAREVIQKLKKSSVNTKVMLGGRAITMSDPEVKKLGADTLVISGAETTHEARRVAGIVGSAHSLSQALGEIGSRIHFYRKSQKMSQEKLASASGLDRAYISSVENGKQNITIGALLKLSEALGIELADLIHGSK